MSSDTFPIRHGTPDQFQALRNLLERIDYTESGICRRLGVASIADMVSAGRIDTLPTELVEPIDVLVKLFIECEPVDRAKAESLLGSSGMSALSDLGLLTPHEGSPDRAFTPVILYPSRSLYIVSDRGDASGPEDVVYPAFVKNTQEFLDLLPPTHCERFLDLGAGSGIAALVAAAGYAEKAWACDITARSAWFSEFNRRLNGIDNVVVSRGDLYEAVEELEFDRIVTHPPYVPAPQQTRIFRDGGEDGEQILRRAIEGLPKFLSPGGRFYALTLGTDRHEEPFEARIRKWLGDSGPEFDVVLITESIQKPSDFLGHVLPHAFSRVSSWNNFFRKFKVEYVVYGSIIIQRRQEARSAFTVRVQKSAFSGLAETEWLFSLEEAVTRSDGNDLVLRSRPYKSVNLHLAVLHKMQNDELVPAEFMLRVLRPFETECKCGSWVVDLVSKCDGQTTGLEHFERLRSQQTLPEGTTAEEFAEVLRILISSGFIEIQGFPVPSGAKQ